MKYPCKFSYAVIYGDRHGRGFFFRIPVDHSNSNDLCGEAETMDAMRLAAHAALRSFVISAIEKGDVVFLVRWLDRDLSDGEESMMIDEVILL